MSQPSPRRVMIAGTDTGVGKTVVTVAVARWFQSRAIPVGLYKPACSGSEPGHEEQPVWGDIEQHWAALEGAFPRDWICPQRFRAPLAPCDAARAEGRMVDDRLLRTGADVWTGQVDLLLIEGAGGLLSPLSDETDNATLAADLQTPLILVSAWRLGAVNQTLLTLEVARGRGLSVAAVVLNEVHPGEADSPAGQSSLHLLRSRLSASSGTAAPGSSATAARSARPAVPLVESYWEGSGDLLQQKSFRTIDWQRLIW